MPKYTLGIDVGGSKVASALVDRRLKFKQLRVAPTSHEDLYSQLMEIISSYKNFNAVALGMPGQVLESGMVRKLGNVASWEPVNLKRTIEKRFKVRAGVINDAKSFALAQAIVGEGKKYQTVVGLILGTGIGAGLVINKKIYFGKNRMAGEIGHLEMLNGNFLEEEIRKAGPFKDAAEAHKFLRTLMSVIVRSWDPEIIVVGGGWSGLPGMEKQLSAILSALKKFPIQTKVKVTKLKYAGIIGAVLALKQ